MFFFGNKERVYAGHHKRQAIGKAVMFRETSYNNCRRKNVMSSALTDNDKIGSGESLSNG
jgi:hypothetical protein